MWVKLGGEGGGFEALGQTLLGTAGSLLLLILLLIIPAALWFHGDLKVGRP